MPLTMSPTLAKRHIGKSKERRVVRLITAQEMTAKKAGDEDLLFIGKKTQCFLFVSQNIKGNYCFKLNTKGITHDRLDLDLDRSRPTTRPM